MSKKTAAPRLRGIIPPLVTPLLDRDTLDVAGLERLLERLITAKVHALFILGTTGEAPSLSYRLRQEMISHTTKIVKGRLPVLVGITDTSFMESVRLANYAADKGVTYLVTSTPYYFPTGQPELLEFIERLVPELPLEVFLYNMPSMTKVQFEVETLRRVSHIKKIIGLKDSSGDRIYFTKALGLAAERPDWSFLMGPEALLAQSIKCGGHGGVSGGAQVYPELFVDLYNSAATDDWKRVDKLQKTLLQLGKIYQIGKHTSAVIKGIKCALSLQGVCSGEMAEPFTPFRKPERERVKLVLEFLGLPMSGKSAKGKKNSKNAAK
jgi:4-hydroxy-tetrahydrodipicolinate synthase